MDLTGATWRKSSYSASNGGDCIEVAAMWRKSSYSGSNGGNCIEVAGNAPGMVAVRDSKDPDGQKLLFTAAEWREFAGRVRSGATR